MPGEETKGAWGTGHTQLLGIPGSPWSRLRNAGTSPGPGVRAPPHPPSPRGSVWGWQPPSPARDGADTAPVRAQCCPCPSAGLAPPDPPPPKPGRRNRIRAGRMCPRKLGRDGDGRRRFLLALSLHTPAQPLHPEGGAHACARPRSRTPELRVRTHSRGPRGCCTHTHVPKPRPWAQAPPPFPAPRSPPRPQFLFTVLEPPARPSRHRGGATGASLVLPPLPCLAPVLRGSRLSGIAPRPVLGRAAGNPDGEKSRTPCGSGGTELLCVGCGCPVLGCPSTARLSMPGWRAQGRVQVCHQEPREESSPGPEPRCRIPHAARSRAQLMPAPDPWGN